MRKMLDKFINLPMNQAQFNFFSQEFLKTWNATHQKIITATEYGTTNHLMPLSRDNINDLLKQDDLDLIVVQSAVCDRPIMMLMQTPNTTEEAEGLRTTTMSCESKLHTVGGSDGMIMDVIQELLKLRSEGRKVISYHLEIEHVPMNHHEAPVTFESEVMEDGSVMSWSASEIRRESDCAKAKHDLALTLARYRNDKTELRTADGTYSKFVDDIAPLLAVLMNTSNDAIESLSFEELSRACKNYTHYEIMGTRGNMDVWYRVIAEGDAK